MTLVDYDVQNDHLTYESKIPAQNATFMGLVEGHLVLLIQNCEFICYGMPDGEEVNKIQVASQDSPLINVKACREGFVFVQEGNIGYIRVPSLEMIYFMESGHEGDIIDFEVSDSCIFTTGADSTIRVFDLQTGHLTLEPLEDMECSDLTWHEESLLVRCGDGSAIIVFRVSSEQGRLEEVQFLEQAS